MKKEYLRPAFEVIPLWGKTDVCDDPNDPAFNGSGTPPPPPGGSVFGSFSA